MTTMLCVVSFLFLLPIIQDILQCSMGILGLGTNDMAFSYESYDSLGDMGPRIVGDICDIENSDNQRCQVKTTSMREI